MRKLTCWCWSSQELDVVKGDIAGEVGAAGGQEDNLELKASRRNVDGGRVPLVALVLAELPELDRAAVGVP